MNLEMLILYLLTFDVANLYNCFLIYLGNIQYIKEHV